MVGMHRRGGTGGVVRVEGFEHNLSVRDRELLRAAVRRVHFSQFPADYVTIEECDAVIRTIYPEVVERMVREQLDGAYLELAEMERQILAKEARMRARHDG